MKFFIDTANLEQIKEAQALGILDGVTTNPSLMAKEGITGAENILQHYKDICDIVDGDVSAEVIATDFENMISEGTELAAAEKKPRKASAYSRRYGKAFKKVSMTYKKKNGEWKKNGFRSAVRAGHKLAKSNRKL